MAKITNSFVGGMSRDTSPIKQDNQHSYYIENLRLTDNSGLSKAVLKNDKGTTLKIHFYYGAYDPPIIHEILTHTFIRGDLILFTKLSDGTVNGYRIYRITSKQLLDSIANETEIEINDNYYHDDVNFLISPEDIVNHLVYTSDNLNFDSDYPIKTFGIYESPTIQKIYFLDELNGFRYLNLIHNSDYNDLENSDLNLYTISQISINPPVPTVYNGGNIPIGKIQYAVQFYTNYGAESLFSPVSNPVFITNSIISPTYNYNLRGDDEGDISNKSVQLSISLNTAVSTTLDEFSRMRCVAIEYSTPTLVPNIRVFSDSAISGDTLTVLDTGVSLGTLSLEEFRGLSNFLFTPSYIDAKDNYLFAANIKEEFFNIGTYDSRAYRFNSGTIVSTLFENDGTSYSLLPNGSWTKGATSGTDWSIPSTADCINSGYNSLTPSNQNMYQTDGVTPGAEGKNIKLTIIKSEIEIDNVWPSSTIDTRRIHLVNSPMANSTTGVLGYYLSGEVYRIGIVFRNSFGVRSRPQWVCDLKFPDHYDPGNYIADPTAIADYSTGAETDYHIFHLAVAVKTMPTDAISWEIVRCRRTDVDKTILGYGALKALAEVNFDGNDILAFSDIPMCDEPSSTHYLEGGTLSLRNNIFGFVSPDFLIENLKLEDGYLFKAIGVIGNGEVNAGKLETLLYPDQIGGNESYAAQVKYVDITKFGTNIYHDLNISDYANLQEEPFGVYGNVLLTGETDSIRNLTFRVSTSGTNDEFGQGGKVTVIKFSSNLASTLSYLNTTYYDLIYGYIHRDSYSSIYGGNTYNNRINSEYIGCNNESVLVNTVVTIYGGDTFPGMFTYTNSHILPNTEVPAGDTGNKIYSYFSFPVECSYNLYLQNGVSSTSESDNLSSCMIRTNAGAYQTLGDTNIIYTQEKGLYEYNRSYSRDLDGQKFVAEEDLYRETEFDCRIYGSNLKTNGELSDSWLKFGVDNFIDVDTRYGPITKLFLHNDQLFFFQEKAFGYIPINEETTIATDTNAKLALASGGILERVKYISTETGALNYKEILGTKHGIFWVDRINKSICLYSGSESSLSDLKIDKDMESYVNWFTDYSHPIYVGYYDDKKDVYFSNETLNLTLVYNLQLGGFSEVQTFSSKDFVKIDKYMLSGNMDTTTYSSDYYNYHIHGFGDRGSFYGVVSPSKLQFIINPGGVAIYDTLEWFSECATELGAKINKSFSTIRVKTGYQDSSELTLTLGSNLGQRFRTWFTQIPRALYDLNGNSLERNDGRMKDYYLLVEFEFDNTNNDEFVVGDITTDVTHGKAKTY